MELPNTVRNVNKSWGVSNTLVMSREDVYAVAGIRLVYFSSSCYALCYYKSTDISLDSVRDIKHHIIEYLR